MEEKGLSFTGITQAASDLDCRDGDLSISHNIINQDGAMRAIAAPDVAFLLEAGEQLLYVHKGNGYKNYFVTDGASLQYFPDEKKTERHSVLPLNGKRISEMVSMGESVCLLYEDGLTYLLYADNRYKVLGSKPPELQISFGLVGRPQVTVRDVKVDCSSNDAKIFKGGFYPLESAEADKATDQLTAKANEVFASFRRSNLFSHPFLVCYAYKLLGQSDYMVSPPVVMQPVKYGSYPFMQVTDLFVNHNCLKDFTCNMIFAGCSLDYRIDKDLLKQLQTWKDIITSVDIYVSPEVPVFKQDGKFDGVYEYSGVDNLVSCTFGTMSLTVYDTEAQYESENPIYAEQGTVSNNGSVRKALRTPSHPFEEIEKNLRSASNFYLYKSYRVEDLKTVEMIRPEEGILENLATRPSLKAVEDYNSHDLISAEKAIVYNGRLHLCGVKKKFFGFNPAALVAYNNGVRTNAMFFDPLNYSKETYDYRFTYLIKEDGKPVKSVSGLSALNNVDEILYYPNPNVVKVLIEKIKPNETLYSEDRFKSHEFLNASMSLSDKRDYNRSYQAADYEAGTQAYDYNKIYTSDINSIFNFPLSGRTTIGTGTVYGVSGVSKALSPGQFGQFPLYAFSSDGVYAMEVNPNTGLFSSVHLISRDVCNQADSITQIDGAVVFSSEKGIMLVEGSEVRLISAELDGPSFNTSSVAGLNSVFEKEGALTEIGGMVRFAEFIRHCQIAYDYPNHRIMVFRSDLPYAYVYSLNSRCWATVSADFERVVTDYPNVYLQSSHRAVYDLFEKTDYDSGKEAKTLLVSRPLKLGSDTYKSVNAVIMRGLLKNRGLSVVLFASSDGITYFPIGSAAGRRLTRLQGSPYRYFRLAVVGTMSVDEALSMCSVFVTPKWRNKPR